MHLTETLRVLLYEKIAFEAESHRETVRGILSPLGVSHPSTAPPRRLFFKAAGGGAGNECGAAARPSVRRWCRGHA